VISRLREITRNTTTAFAARLKPRPFKYQVSARLKQVAPPFRPMLAKGGNRERRNSDETIPQLMSQAAGIPTFRTPPFDSAQGRGTP
jgi:hypothetical protein